MPQWSVAPSLRRLLEQLNDAYPNRSKASDGSIGDTAHAARKSDHNPDEHGIVRAIDITHDPENGVNCHALAKALKNSADPRISYVIWDYKIMRSYSTRAETEPWLWYPYRGDNNHTKHLHISVLPEQRDWKI